MTQEKREQIATDRARLEQEFRALLDALRATPEYAAFAQASYRLDEHTILYGVVGGAEPVGILNARERR